MIYQLNNRTFEINDILDISDLAWRKIITYDEACTLMNMWLTEKLKSKTQNKNSNKDKTS